MLKTSKARAMLVTIVLCCLIGAGYYIEEGIAGLLEWIFTLGFIVVFLSTFWFVGCWIQEGE